MRSDYIKSDTMHQIITALMPINRLVILTCLATGLRINDVLCITTEQLLKSQRFTIKEQKTAKTRRIYIPKHLYAELVEISGKRYVFEGRNDYRKHRTRQAVHKDIKRVAKLYRIDGKKISANVTPHSARKIYAVEQFKKYGDIKKVQKLLNHNEPTVTMIYAMSDIMTERRKSPCKI